MKFLGLLASDSSLVLNVVRYLKANCVVYGLHISWSLAFNLLL